MESLVSKSRYSLMLLITLLELLGWTNTAAAQATPLDVARSFFDALNKADKTTALTLVNPDGDFIENADTPLDHRHNLKIFVDEVGSGAYGIDILRAEQTDSNTVAMDLAVTGPDIPVLPHPFVLNANITVANGRIEKMVMVFSEQTLKDLEALPAPGMPTTGAATEQNIVAALVGITLLLIGLSLVQRFRRSRI